MKRSAFFFMKKIQWMFGIALIAGLAFISFANGQAKARPAGSEDPKWVPLFTAVGIERAGADAVAPQASRYRSVSINRLVSEAGGLAVGDRLFISPFDDAAAVGTIDRVETDVNGVLAVRARIMGPDGYLLLSSKNGRSLGQLVLPDQREFEISCVAGGPIHIIQEFAPGARVVLNDGPSPVEPGSVSEGPVAPAMIEPEPAAANTRFDVLIAYTLAARDWAGGTTGIDLVISQSFGQGNTALDNSQVAVTLRLVRSALVNYTENPNNMAIDLDRLTNKTDGYIDEIHQWRNTYGADLVSLVTLASDNGGLGWVLNSVSGSPDYAFNVVRVQQIGWTTTMVHEEGHNVGCAHRKDQGGTGLFPYSFGWRWIGNDGLRYCDVMSYTDAWDGNTVTGTPYFSSPLIFYKGAATGTTEADNARTIRETKTVVSNYRADSGMNTLTLTAGTGGTTNPIPGTYTFATGSVLQIIAVPDANYSFLNWTGSDTGTQTWIIITLDRDKTLAAAFQRNIYAPTNASGIKVLNRSLSQAEYINIISFQANLNNVNILAYKIYQVENGQRTEIASVDATTFSYRHRGVVGTKAYTYHIVAVNSEPREGAAAVVNIQ